MNKILTSLMIVLLLVLPAVAAYPVDFKIHSNLASFNTYIYKCGDSNCNTITYYTSVNSGGYTNEFSISGSGTQTFAEYEIKDNCYASHGYKINMYSNTGNGPWNYYISFNKIPACMAGINTFTMSATSVNIGTPITINTNVQSSFNKPVGGPNTYPEALKVPYYSSHTIISLIVKDANSNIVYQTSTTKDIFMDSNANAAFSWTPTKAGIYSVYIQTEVDDCKCSSDNLQSQVKTITVTSPDQIPDAQITANPSSGTAPLTSTLTCTATGGDSPVSYTLFFGDGTFTSSTSAITVSHAYNAAATYTATCSVTDSDGDSDSATKSVSVTAQDLVPTAHITASPTSGQAPLTSTLTCTATGGDSPISYTLNFGDGQSTTSTSMITISHVYNTAGDFNAICSVTDADGDLDTDSTTVTATSADLTPTAHITASPTSGTAPLTSTLTCTATGGDSPISYTLFFGDGTSTSSTSQISVAHTYSSAGTYNAVCYVTDTDGDSDTDSATISVTSADLIPVAHITANPTSGQAPLTSTLICSATGGDNPISYILYSGDGQSTTSAGQISVTHTYSSAGTYNAVCSVTDTDGDSDTDSTTITVTQDNIPIAHITASPSTGQAPMVSTLTCTATGGDSPISYTLFFGDGTSTSSTNQISVAHTYSSAGTYNPICSVTDNDGDLDTDSTTITVTADLTPIAQIRANPISGQEPLSTVISCNGTGGNAPLSYVLYFGDGQSTTSANPISISHVYANDGTYTATCTATDADGDSDSKTTTITATADLVPTALINANPTNGQAPLTSTLTCTATGGNTPLSYTLYFGDGQSTTSASAITTTHTYNSAAVYTPLCSVTDSDGDFDTDSTTITVTADLIPVAHITASPSTGQAPMVSTLTCTATGGDNPILYTLYFGDGTFTSSTNPITSSHSYNTAGNFNAICSVTDADGDYDTDSTTITTIQDQTPTAHITASPISGTEPLTVSLTCSGTGGDGALTYVLYFGDGLSISASSQISTTHTYSAEGVYTAICQATDSDGDSDTDSATISVLDTVPIAVLTANLRNGEAPLTVNINCTSIGGDLPITYVLYFGDESSPVVQQTPIFTSHTYDEEGIFTASCAVLDADWDYNQTNLDFTVEADSVPTAHITANPDNGQSPLLTTIVCNGTGGDTPLQFILNFGDGSAPMVSTIPITTTHIYAQNGNYYAECLVKDTDGDADSDNVQIHVGPIDQLPTADLDVVPPEGVAPFTPAIYCSAVGGDAPISYSLNFGDGSSVLTSLSPIATTHTFNTIGYYQISCTVTDLDGDTDTETMTVHVTQWVDLIPEASIDVDFDHGAEPLNTNISCTGTGGNTPLTYRLYFGDGQSTSSSMPISVSHTYTRGDYTAICIVTDSDGDSDSASATITALSDPIPVAVITANPTQGNAPLTASINCTGYDGNQPLYYSLSFGDGTSTSGYSPIVTAHTYQSTGNYNAVCTVTDNDGDADSDGLIISVGTQPPANDTNPDVFCNAVPKSGTAPLNVTFTAWTVGGNGIIDYSWFFGEGGSTDTANVTYTYYDSGLYQGTVTVTDGDGDTDTCRVWINTTSTSPDLLPDAHITANPTTGLEPLTSTLTCTATGGNLPLSYTLYFGDGQSTTSTSPITTAHTYNNGAYTAICVVTDADGDSDSESILLNVADDDVPAVQCSVTPTSGQAPLTVSFTGTVIGGNGPYLYVWNFDDGTTSTQLTTTHTYISGTYNAALLVRDADGDTATCSAVINSGSQDLAPEANISATPTSGYAPLTSTLTCSATGGNSPISYTLYFGDGQSTTSANPITTTHMYNSAGTYTAICFVVDTDGDSDTDSLTVSAANDDIPAVQCSVTPTSGTSPMYVSFSGTVIGGNTPYTYLWNFGDGATNSQLTTTHIYNNAGTYNANLTVRDTDGDTATCSAQITATQTANDTTPTAHITANPTTGLEPLTSTVTCDGTGGNAPLSFTLYFGDGQSTTSTNPITITHVYNSAGTYNAICLVVDSDGDSDTDSITISAANDDIPAVQCSVTPTSGTAPLTVSFTGTVTGGNTPFSYAWNFGDGATSAQLTTAHTYNAGIYAANLTVTDIDGDKAVCSAQITVSTVCADTDHDGICDTNDNCRTTYNPTQSDADSDGIGDSCDNCVSVYNPTQSDSDHDGIGDACEAAIYQCNDGVDNDGDGKIDYPNDPGCTGPTDNNETEIVIYQCSDGVDNDGDLRIDSYDPGCYVNGAYDPTHDDESDHGMIYQCSDSIDNDGDGYTDYPNDGGCSSPVDNDETNGQCSDKKDNDGDGYVDKVDPACNKMGYYDPMADETKNNHPIFVNDREKNDYDLSIQKLKIISNNREGIEDLVAGDTVLVVATMKNTGKKSINKLKVTVFVPDIGEKAVSGYFNIKPGETVTKKVYLPIPGNAEPGIYDVMVKVSGKEVSRIKYRPVTIIEQ